MYYTPRRLLFAASILSLIYKWGIMTRSRSAAALKNRFWSSSRISKPELLMLKRMEG
jgi:hypothetical protein